MAEKKEKQYVSDNAQLMAEWDWKQNSVNGFDPEQLTCGSVKKVWWKCKNGHHWQAPISSRNCGHGCPYCAGTHVIKGENDLQTVNPAISKEWDYDKNDGLTPVDVSPNSHKKIWWKCSKGHEWQAAVSKRTLGQNCPFCSGNKALQGYNDLSIIHPELVSEWDFQKNETPIYAYRPMSNKKVWWICNKGHSWEAAISKRVNGQKCPICQGKQLLIGFNDLATTHPILAREWDYEKNTKISPFDVSKGSTAKVWWKCRFSHSWQAAVYSRVSGIGCPQCSRELQSSFPEKAIFFYVKKMCSDAVANYRSDKLSSFELDIYVPSLQIGIEYDGERWHQSLEKDIFKNNLCAERGILLFRIREPACPVLLDSHSICIIRESKKSGLDKTITKLLCEISKTANIECAINVDIEKDSTSILELLSPLEKENNILSQNHIFIDEWDYQKNGTLLPTMVTAGSDKKVWWTCRQGHSYQASISSRTRARSCPICAGKRVLKGYNDFESKYPELAKDWDYIRNSVSPDMVAYGSDKKFWWICDKGHSYECSINNRRAGQQCPYCSGKRVLSGFNDISTTHPEIAEQWCFNLNGFDPTEVTAGSHKKVWWQCNICGHKWMSYVYNRCLNNAGCPKCSGRVK